MTAITNVRQCKNAKWAFKKILDLKRFDIGIILKYFDQFLLLAYTLEEY